MDYAAYLVSIIEGLASKPEAIGVTMVNDEKGILLTLDVHYSDMGRIIGKGGETAKAIRSILHTAGMHRNAKVSLKINEPAGSTRKAGAQKQQVTTIREERGDAPAMKSIDEALETL